MTPKVRELFRTRFGSDPQSVARAPGRVEILGNHTDYNEGFVLTAAINKCIEIAGKTTGGEHVTLYTHTLEDDCVFSVHDLQKDQRHPWADYIKGVLYELQNKGIPLSGFQACITGDLPVGGGVSSSAALESASLLLLQSLFVFDLPQLESARLCQRAENQFAGMPCGILDPMSCLLGKQNALLFIDCRTLNYERLLLPQPAPEIVVCNSRIKHQLVQSEYRLRREQCERAARQLSTMLHRPVPFLRDITWDELLPVASRLTFPEDRRARHVVSENRRVCLGREALRSQDVRKLGALLFESHESSKALFENSCKELDVLVELAASDEACLGAKLSGGGFGGCTVNLVAHGEAEEYCKRIQNGYQTRTGQECSAMICSIADGASLIS